MKNYSLKNIIYIAYFTASWLPLCINEDAPLWAIALVILNFGNAVRLINKVPLNIEE